MNANTVTPATQELRRLKKLEPKELKNKYNLTESQIVEMEDMKPKEKKKYLKGLK